MRPKKKTKTSNKEILIRSYASLLQQHLNIITTVCSFYNAGTYGPVHYSPCSLITVEPFCPGGLRRLVLNLHHPLILELAIAAATEDEDLSKTKNGSKIMGKKVAIAIGEAMVWTGSWPMDLRVPLVWKMSKGLICGPHWNMVSPVPHEEVIVVQNVGLKSFKDENNTEDIAEDHAGSVVAMSIWPKRLYSVDLKRDKSNPSKYVKKITTTQGDRWKQRDGILWDEWRYFYSSKAHVSLPSRFLNFTKSLSSTSTPQSNLNIILKSNEGKVYTKSTATMLGSPILLVTYAPVLPILVLAHYLQDPRRRLQSQRQIKSNGNHYDINTRTTDKIKNETTHQNLQISSRATSITDAASILLSTDRLFCLSLFFGVPLLDRTGTLRSALHLHPISKCTPGKEEMVSYLSSLSSLGWGRKDVHYVALERAMMDRAEIIWTLADGEVGSGKKKKVLVCWSGGIDSTSALVCLLRTSSSSNDRRDRLVVVVDDISISENPTFYETHLAKDEDSVKKMSSSSGLSIVRRNEKTLSELATWAEGHYGDSNGHGGVLVVTGELGDQLFGSDKCKVAFPEKKLAMDNNTPISNLGDITLNETEKKFISSISLDDDYDEDVSLSEPWENTFLKMLDARHLLAGRASEWRDWIDPQLAKAPFPIVSLHDMLWWLNFSCKWQGVSLRCLHDGGAYKLPHFKDNRIHRSLTGSILHFFDDRQLECWACVPEFHTHKFADMNDWQTYKEPLKKLINSYHPNDGGYYRNKEKVGSLGLDLTEAKQRRVESCAGLVFEDSTKTILRFGWGRRCVTDYQPIYDDGQSDSKYCGLHLQHILDPWILEKASLLSIKMSADIETVVNLDPWTVEDAYISPFTHVPSFADNDERQRRIFNPVTAITLEAKCAALLPPHLVQGKTILDLGACLGAMCHWSLFHGAKYVVAVETQQNFCERMEKLFCEAKHTWPRKENKEGSKERYKVVCADIRTFLSQCQNQSFDIVVAAGVLHCFQDPISIILEAARVSNEALMIESTHPPFNLSGAGSQQQHRPGDSCPRSSLLCRTPIFGNESRNLLEIAPSAQVNKAGENVSFTGLAIIPSKEAIQNVMRAAGFSVSSVILPSHPNVDEDVLTYTGVRRFEALPRRFFLRSFRCSTKSLKTLEEAVITGKSNENKWTNTYLRWNHFVEEDIESSPTLKVMEASNENLRKFQTNISTDKSSNNAVKPKSFIAWKDVETLAHEVSYDESRDQHPFRVSAWGFRSVKTCFITDDPDGIVYGYVYSGETTIRRTLSNSTKTTSNLVAGMFFCCPGRCQVEGGSGLVVTVNNKQCNVHCNRSIFMIGGPLENDEQGDLIGALPYIDGCTDTVLIHPQIKGNPCLNHLHFPQHIKQTQHTHPSGRAGIVVRGKGECVIVDENRHKTIRIPLRPGMVFVIPTNAPHAFETSDSILDVIAFHPDSDYGPTSTDHPMVNRTMIGGISASLIPSIQTVL